MFATLLACNWVLVLARTARNGARVLPPSPRLHSLSHNLLIKYRARRCAARQ